LAEEKALLPSWDSEDISHSPKIRAANATVDRLTSLVQRIESSQVDQSVWTSYVDELLE
jgi:hypothetical protein